MTHCRAFFSNQRKGKRNKPPSKCQQHRNHRIAKTGVRVEHECASIEQMGGKLIEPVTPWACQAAICSRTCGSGSEFLQCCGGERVLHRLR